MNKIKEKEKQAITSIADTLAREGCALVPGGGVAYDGIKALVNYGKQYYEERNNTRLEKFHEQLLINDDSKVESIEYLNKEYSADDYYSLLKSMLQDDEDEKVVYYSYLMKSIINRSVSIEYKKHFIRTIKDINSYDFKLIRNIYIYSNFELTSNGKIESQLQQYSNNKSPIVRASLANLVRLGYLEFSNELYVPTELLEELAQCVFNSEDLEPASIGEVELHKVDVFVATFVDEQTLQNQGVNIGPYTRTEDEIKKYSEVLSSIKKVLDKTGLTYKVSNPEFFTEAQKSASLIVLCLDHVENPMLFYSWDKELLQREKVFKVIMDKLRTTGQPYDTLPGTEALRIFDFSSLEEKALDAFKYEVEKFFS